MQAISLLSSCCLAYRETPYSTNRVCAQFQEYTGFCLVKHRDELVLQVLSTEAPRPVSRGQRVDDDGAAL
jgi:hypothetical protein